MTLPVGVKGRAYPEGLQLYRQWLSREWDPTLPVALVIGINPHKATEAQDDGMTGFLTRLLRGLDGEFLCGGYILVNCFDYRDRAPTSLLDVPEPSSAKNLPTIRRMVKKCDFIVASWGTTDYGMIFDKRRSGLARLVKASGKPAICFSPRGAPVYCSQTNANSGDGRWSRTPVRWSDALSEQREKG
jgi:hypothetical protein